MNLYEKIKSYKAEGEQEENDRRIMLGCIESMKDTLTRKNEVTHFSASAWVVNRECTKVLMAYHNIYRSWSWTGGHADGEEDLLQVALREAKEETGIKHIHPVFEDIFSLEILTVDAHRKNGKHVSAHLHMNVTYLLEADETDSLSVKPDENSGVMWMTPEEVICKCTEECMIPVYKKLICKTNKKR